MNVFVIIFVLALLPLGGWPMDDELTRAVKQFAPNAFEVPKSPSGSGKSSGGSNSNRPAGDELTGAVRQFAPNLYGGDTSSGKKAEEIKRERIAKITQIRRLAPDRVRAVFAKHARTEKDKQQRLVDPSIIREVLSGIAAAKNPDVNRRSPSPRRKVLDKNRGKKPLMSEVSLPKVVNFKEDDLKEFVEELAAQEVQAAQQEGGSPGWSPMEFDLDEMHAILKTMDLVDKGKEKITEEDLVEIPAEQFQQAAAGTRERVRHNVHGLLQEVLEEIRQPETWLEREVIDSYLDRITSYRQDMAFVPAYVIEQFGRQRTIASNWLQTIQNLHQIRMFFVPIHLHGNHWALAVWDRRTDDDAIEVFDSLITDDTLDEKLQFLNALMAFFKEICVQNGQQWDNPASVPLKRVPQQPNGYDCGVFALMFAHYIATEGRLDASKFGQSEVDTFRQKIYRELRDIYFPRGSGGRSKSAGASRGRERGASAEQRGHSKSQGKRSRSGSGGKKFSEDSVNDAHMRKRSNSQNLERTSSAKRDDKGDGKTRSKSGSRKDRHGSMSRSGSRSGSRSRSRSRSRSASGGSRSRSGSRSGSSGTGRRETKAGSRHSAQQPSGSQSRGKKPYGKRSQEEQGSQKPTRKSRDSRRDRSSGSGSRRETKSAKKEGNLKLNLDVDNLMQIMNKQNSSRDSRRDRNKPRSGDRSRSRSSSRSSRSGSRSGSRSQGGGAEHRSHSGNRSGSKNNRSGSRSGSSHRSGSRSGDRKQSKKSKARAVLQRSPSVQLDAREVTRMPMLNADGLNLIYKINERERSGATLINQLPEMKEKEFEQFEKSGHIFEGTGHRVDKSRGGGTYYICTHKGSCYGRLVVYKNKHFRRTALHSCDEAKPVMKKPVHGRVCVIPVQKAQKYMVKLNCAAKHDLALTIWTKYMPEGQRCTDYVADVQYCEGKFHFEVGIGQMKLQTFCVPEGEVNVINVLHMNGQPDILPLLQKEDRARGREKSASDGDNRSRSGSASRSNSRSRGDRSKSARSRSGSRSGGRSKHTKRSKHHQRSGSDAEPKRGAASEPAPPLRRSPSVQFDGREVSQRTRMPILHREALGVRDRNTRVEDLEGEGVKFSEMNDKQFAQIGAKKQHNFEGILYSVDRTRGDATYYRCSKRGKCFGRLTVFKNKRFRRTSLHTCEPGIKAMRKPVHGRVCVSPVQTAKEYRVELNCADEYNLPLTIWAKYMPKGQWCLDFVADVQYCSGKYHFEVSIDNKNPNFFHVPQGEVNVTNILDMEGK